MASQGLRAIAPEEAEDDALLTIEELAARTGMTVRNIRAHQSRGLLPSPQIRASVGYYGGEHVARLELIREMQDDGYNLASIKRLLDGAPGAAEKVLGLRRAVTEPFEDEEPVLVTAAELAARFGDQAADGLGRAIKLGLVVPLGDDRFEVPSPTLLAAAEEVVGRGVPLPTALKLAERLRRQAESVARSFVKMFLDEVWRPFADAGYPEERWDEMVESIERLRPLATQSLVAVFQQTMTREVETAFGKALERAPSRVGGSGGSSGSGRRP
jgi:DNA-binding transcriptional MerR regulator